RSRRVPLLRLVLREARVNSVVAPPLADAAVAAVARVAVALVVVDAMPVRRSTGRAERSRLPMAARPTFQAKPRRSPRRPTRLRLARPQMPRRHPTPSPASLASSAARPKMAWPARPRSWSPTCLTTSARTSSSSSSP
ncbi:hypothetical protein LTR53_019594, partial [Teratosphaeriaceae sp. CCFEE 6253]